VLRDKLIQYTTLKCKRSVVDITESNTLEIFAHICHVPANQLIRTVLCYTGKNERVRPAKRWTDNITE